MSKYLKSFETHSDYETYIGGQDAILPNVSYCENNNEVHYNPVIDYTIRAIYNVTDISNPTRIGGVITVCSYVNYGLSNVSKLIIDGVETEVPTPQTSGNYGYFYQFTETGEHTIDYVVNTDGTYINGTTFYNCNNLISLYIPNGITSAVYSSNGALPSSLETIVVARDNKYLDSRNNCNAIIETSTNKLKLGCNNTTIPNGITAIENYAFYNCTSLTGTLTIPDSVTSIGLCAFSGCSGLTGTLTIPDSVTSIGQSAFNNCSNITKLIIGNGLTQIPRYCFHGCSSITTVTMGSGVTSVGEYCFDGCGITKTIVPDIAAWCNINFTSNGNNPAIISHNIYSDENTEITNLVIPNGVTSIGQCAFFRCYNITSVTIPSSVTTIGINAFSQCTGLTKVNSNVSGECIIPGTVTSVNGGFGSCSGFTSIVISNGVTSINGFSGCSNVTNVSIGNTVTSIGNSTFSGCTGLTSITIPDSVTSIGNNVFENCTGLTTITIGSGVTTMGNYVFQGCSSLSSITSLSMTQPLVGNYTFYYIKTGGTLYVPTGSTYTNWMKTSNYYLGNYNWTKVEQ